MMKLYKPLCFLFCFLLCISCCICASAAQIETEKTVDLSLRFAPHNTPAVGVQYRLYRIADVSQDVRFSYVSPYSSYPIAPVGNTTEQWRNLAQTLQGFIVSDGIAADYTAVTDSNGTFRTDGLPTGLYLLTGDPITIDKTVYTPQPFLLCLPVQAGDTWTYDVHIDAKYDEYPADTERTVQILKVWQDQNSPQRPIQATVALYGDGKLYETVVLDKNNNWKHTWKNLSAMTVWTVNEVDVPAGYIVSVGQEHGLFGVVNSVPGDDEGSTNEPSTIPDDEPTSTPTEEPTTEPDGEPELPNTGLLWWPVPVLVFGGLVFIVAGITRRRGKQDEE